MTPQVSLSGSVNSLKNYPENLHSDKCMWIRISSGLSQHKHFTHCHYSPIFLLLVLYYYITTSAFFNFMGFMHNTADQFPCNSFFSDSPSKFFHQVQNHYLIFVHVGFLKFLFVSSNISLECSRTCLMSFLELKL